MQSTISAILLLLASTSTGYLLPAPEGKYNVALTTGPLVDYTRNDPFADHPMPRALMLSVFHPATCQSTHPVPYMPNTTALYQGPYLQQAFNITEDFSPLFTEAELPICPSQPSKDCSTPHNPPILLLSPGWGTPRFYYNVLASAIASNGFTVITIDHPHDANIITYPNSDLIYQNLTTWNDSFPIENEHTRAADASFIINQLTTNASAVASLFPRRRGPRVIAKDRPIGILGHSLGGATALVVAGQDARIGAAINWDGTIFGPLPTTSGLKQPVLLMMNAETETPPDWVEAWPLLKGPKLWVEVANTTHQSFSDMGTLVAAYAAGQGAGADAAALGGEEQQAELAELLGTIEPGIMVEILAEYAAAWMKAAFASYEKDGKFELEEETLEFAEVSTVEKASF